MNPRTRTAAAMIRPLFAAAGVAHAQDAPPPDPRIEEATGRELVNWPKDRLFDHTHMRLELDFPSMSEPKLRAVETLRVRALGAPRDTLVLDCNGPKVARVSVGNQDVPFESADKHLTVHFPKALRPGEEAEVVTQYTLDFADGPKGAGLTYTQGRAEADSQTDRSPQIYSQGEAQSNSRWFPCHDFPNERLTTELVVTADSSYEVLSNGRLVSKGAAGEGRLRWDWLQDKPHANYLVCLFIAQCNVVELGGPGSARPGLSIPLYAPIGKEERAAKTYANTPRMIAHFEQTFGAPYPWDKYGQALVRGFNGGMENTSATFMMAGSISMGPAADELISHELAHQWFGDLMTCKSWEHAWLNEGWASYAEALWAEKAGLDAGGKDEALSAYDRVMRGFAQRQRRNRGSLPKGVPMVSNRYKNPDTGVFAKADDIYAKGALILHMLRTRLGDETFFKGVRLYVDRNKFTCVETDDFRKALEEASGQSLERFFAQWAMRPGVPRLGVDLAWDDAASALNVAVEQTQTIDALNPAYALQFPLYVRFEDGKEQWLDVTTNQHTISQSFKLPAKPAEVSVDPEMTQFAVSEIRKPLAMWIDELAHGPTLFARMDAAEHLANDPAPESAAAVRAALADPATPAPVREAAAGGPHDQAQAHAADAGDHQ